MYLTNLFGSVNEYRVGQALAYGCNYLLKVSTERYEVTEKVENGEVVVSIEEGERCVENYCTIYCDQIKM